MTFYMLYLKLQNSKFGVKVGTRKKKKFTGESRRVKILGVRSIKKQEWGFSIGQPYLIYPLVVDLVSGGIL